MSEATPPFIAPHVAVLIHHGVRIPSPGSVEIDPSVSPESIAPGVVIHAGCKILGARTSIGPGSVIGGEAPVTVDNCQLGRGVSLKGGFFSGSAFLDGANVGSGAHIRSGTLLEEEANGAHTVGLKQTILLSYVTLGSLINFCDCLMAGGTSRKSHSEVGSSYIHFNYTPHGDKATPSLIGDIPRGVMLDQPPIFLGGQGGLVGPARIEYGCVIPAGMVCREDALKKGEMHVPDSSRPLQSRPYLMGVYQDITRLVANNLIYIGNIQALQAWYRFVRKPRMHADPFSKACCDGASSVIESVLDERIKRLGAFAAKLTDSAKWHETHDDSGRASQMAALQRAFIAKWPYIEKTLRQGPDENIGRVEREAFLEAWERIDPSISHTKAVTELGIDARAKGTAWLETIVDAAVSSGKIL